MAFVDFSTNNFQISAFGNAQISTSIFRYGGGSALFDGNGDYLQTIIPDTVWNIGVSNQPFTIELWVYRLTSGTQVFVSKHGGVNAWNGTNGLNFNFYYTGTILLFEFWGTSAPQSISNTVNIPTSQWVHLAATYDGTTTRIFVDGVLQGTTSTANYGTTTSANILEVGAQISGSFPFNGYIDGVRVTKGIARYIANFVPPTVAMQTFTDPYYNNVVLLLPMNPGPLVDSSTNNFALSAFGNADISRTVRRNGNYSGYFDGTGDYLMAYTNQEFGTNNWTTEFWFRAESISGEPRMLSRQDAGTGFVYQLRIFNSAPQLLIRRGDGSGYLEVGGITTISTNQWYHIAIVRNGNTISMYIDGTLSDSKTFTGIYSSPLNAPWIIGAFSDSSINPQLYFQGYIDDLRITNGVARYTSTFTPPQQQLPAPTDPFADNVSLLLHMDGLSGTQTFIDSSSNNFALSAFNNAQIATTVRRYGSGSAYFNGTSDYLTLSATDAFNFFNTNYTVEMWVYSAASQTGGGLISTRLAAVYSPWELQITSANKIGFLIRSGASSWYLSGPVAGNTTIPQNQWTHIAWVGNGSNTTVYINGIADSNLTNLNTPILQAFAQPSNIFIGKGGDGDFNGYIDDLRVTKGVARYTANFTPPTAPFPNPVAIDPYDGSVSLLLRMNGDNGSQTFLDSSTNKFTLSAFGNAQVSTAVKKFGTGSGLFDGNGDYLQTVANEAFNFGTGDFTIEAWINLNSIPSDYFIASANSSGGLFFGFRVVSTVNQIGWGRAAIAWDYSVASGITTGQWYHVALSRNGTNMRLFVNGNQVGTTQTNSTSYNLGLGNLAVGAQNANLFLNGYIDDLRITKGVARYTSNFTPPTTPSPNPINLVPPGYIAFWKLNGLTDSSNNSNTLTNNGSARFIPGLLGDCAQFTGSNSVYLQDSPISPAFNPSETFTVSIWVYPKSLTTYQAYIGGPAGSFIIHTTAAGDLVCNNAATADAQASGVLQINTWQHIVFTVGSGRAKVWLNNNKLVDKVKSVTYSSTTNVILGNYGGLNFPYDGLLDSVGLWNRELTQGEITQLYNGGLGLEP